MPKSLYGLSRLRYVAEVDEIYRKRILLHKSTVSEETEVVFYSLYFDTHTPHRLYSRELPVFPSRQYLLRVLILCYAPVQVSEKPCNQGYWLGQKQLNLSGVAILKNNYVPQELGRCVHPQALMTFLPKKSLPWSQMTSWGHPVSTVVQQVTSNGKFHVIFLFEFEQLEPTWLMPLLLPFLSTQSSPADRVNITDSYSYSYTSPCSIRPENVTQRLSLEMFLGSKLGRLTRSYSFSTGSQEWEDCSTTGLGTGGNREPKGVLDNIDLIHSTLPYHPPLLQQYHQHLVQYYTPKYWSYYLSIKQTSKIHSGNLQLLLFCVFHFAHYLKCLGEQRIAKPAQEQTANIQIFEAPFPAHHREQPSVKLIKGRIKLVETQFIKVIIISINSEMSKNFDCPQCKMAFTYPSLYKRHMLVHSVDREFSCPSCPKKFKRPDTLKTHLNRHASSTQMVCCGRMFNSKASLRYHQRKVHSLSQIKLFQNQGSTHIQIKHNPHKSKLQDYSQHIQQILSQLVSSNHMLESIDIKGEYSNQDEFNFHHNLVFNLNDPSL